tara:strand:- start:526 stop:687 length:162 start_codon:yes stop_codon:yes gene_type:complete
MTGRHCWRGVIPRQLFYFALSNDEATKAAPNLVEARSEFSAVNWGSTDGEKIS